MGATLYCVLGGTVPLYGWHTLELILAKETGTFTPVHQGEPFVHERLDLIVDKMLQKEPNHRYANCEQLLSDLASLQLDGAAMSFIDSPRPDKKGTRKSSPRTT